jgi:hypothetical protein
LSYFSNIQNIEIFGEFSVYKIEKKQKIFESPQIDAWNRPFWETFTFDLEKQRWAILGQNTDPVDPLLKVGKLL